MQYAGMKWGRVCLGLAIVTLTACDQPMGPIAGGKLNGETKAWPEDWSFSDSIENILLETQGDEPYSVTLWAVQTGGSFYIAAAERDSRWVQNILVDERVIVSINGALYPGRAVEINDQTEMQAVLTAYVSKYEIEVREGENFIEDGGILFRVMHR